MASIGPELPGGKLRRRWNAWRATAGQKAAEAAAPFGDPRSVRFGLRRRVAVSSLLFLLAVALVTWYLVTLGQKRLIEFQALKVAEVVARLSTSSRSVYSEHVVAKLKNDGAKAASPTYVHERGAVPLPAQFLKLVAQLASAESGGLYSYRPLSKWNLEPSQGLKDGFQRWAWAQLEAQDLPYPAEPIEWRPAWRIEPVDGVSTLRFLRADPAVSATCVECHNHYEGRPETIAMRHQSGVPPGKVWQLNQLMGAVEVNVPLAHVEALATDQNRFTFAVMAALALTGMLCIGFFIFADVSRVRVLTRQLAWRASHDSLTGLINRGQFEQRLAYLLDLAKTDKSAHALMFLDLDQFKVVNDTCGHMAGDSLLQQLGETLKSHLRASDTLARLGGDEFGVLLMNCDTEKAAEVAGKLRDAVAEFRFAWERRIFEIGVSIGVVSVTEDARSTAELMSAADVACYAAKEAGGRRYHLLKPTDTELSRRRGDMEWAGRITRALEEGRTYLMLQPAKALRNGLAVSVYQEVLLRMSDESGNTLPTDVVINAAERHNLMATRLDRWVVQTTLDLIRKGAITANARKIVAINLSGTSLSDDDFLQFVQSEIAASGVNARALCFEITETAAISNISKALVFIRTLKGMGCRFALDDFGSGLCSFGYLKKLPVDFLKIDGEFVRDVVTDPFDRTMVDAIADIGRVMGIPTIAEWVEDERIMKAVKAAGIDYAQGYGIARPERIVQPAKKP